MPKKKTEKKPAAPKAESKPSKKTAKSSALTSTKPRVSSRQPRSRTTASSRKSPANKSAGSSAPGDVYESLSETLIITDDQIAIHAYYISEHRMRNGHPGDATSDWLEAERQLRGL